MLFFTYGFRNFSAIDDPSYIGIFENTLSLGWFEYFKSSTIEPGYLILNDIVGTFTDDYLFMQLITSFIPLFIFYYAFNKYKKLISLPMAVFLLCSMLYFQMLSVALVRMFIAISIIFLALGYIPERRPVKYITLTLIATFFHYSAFIMILLSYFAINKKNLSKKVSRIYTSLFLLSPFVFIAISKLVVPILGSRYQQYGSINYGINFDFSTFSTVPLIFLLLFFIKKFKDKEQLYFKFFLFVYAISVIISLFGGMTNLGRLIFYSYAAFIFCASMVSNKIRFNTSKIIFTSIVIFYGFLYLFYSQFTNEQHIPYLFPYNNILFTL
jgi:EpsG family